jgi:ATP-binding cassette, subfamily C, type I secretion system permease/ATPase
MQTIVKSWLKYLIFVAFFGVCFNLIYVTLPVYMMVVYDKVLFSFSKATLSTLGVGMLICLLIMGLIDYCRTRLLGQLGNRLAEKLLPALFKSMQKEELRTEGQGYSRGLYDLELLRDAMVRGQIFSLLDLPWVLIYLGILYFIHPLVGSVAIIGVFMVSLFQMQLRKIEKKRYVVADVAFRANADFVGSCLQHAPLIHGMGMMSAVMEKYREKYQSVLKAKSGGDAFHAGIGAMIRLVHVAAVVAVFTAGVYVFFANEITMGTIIATVLITARLFYPFDRSLADMKSSIEAMAAYTRLNHFVDIGEEKPLLPLPIPKGKFDVEAVSLVLQGRTILQSVSFGLEPGETLGILGPSSGGKTSLCKAMLGIWPTTAGKIRLDGAEIAHWPREAFGSHVGYMPQEPELLPGSVAENIARLGAIDSEKVIAAAQKAGVHEMILKLAQGYDTLIDRTGKNLSAGQRQLISLARALYGDPKLLVLDEPQTHMDDLGLKSVFQALEHLKQQNITTIVVTDRPNLLVHMDKLLVIREGQVAMYGPGKEVLNQLANRQQPQQASGV